MILEKIELKAEQLLNQLEVKTIPVPVEDIAYSLKIKISRAPSSDFSGLLIRKDGHALIGVNSNEAPTRQRFTIAHELGHFFLHPLKDAFVDFRKELARGETRTPKERQADMFAAALLMPRKQLIRDVKKATKSGVTEEVVTSLAREYAVSEEAMRYRLMNLSSLM